jgi:hypothetical protein
MRSGVVSGTSPCARASTRSSAKVPSSFSGAFACAMIASSSRFASSQAISPVTLPFLTTRYGVSMNPRSLTRAYVASDVMRPMFGPSGVSIGHMRPYCE